MSNDNLLGSKINQLLSNPDSLKDIMAIASSMGLTEKQNNTKDSHSYKENAEEKESLSENTEISPIHMDNIKKDERVELLMSIKPFLGSRKQQKVDGLVKALTAAKLINTYKDSDLMSFLGLK